MGVDTKRRILENGESYKTANPTKRRILQNGESYKTANPKKRRHDNTANIQNDESNKTVNIQNCESYGLHEICDDLVHLQHDQSYMGCR